MIRQSREQVDERAGKAIAAGGRPPGESKNQGFMYMRGFRDLHGYQWSFIYMDLLLQANRFPVGVLRPAAVCGPDSRHLREWWLVKRVLDGRTVVPVKYRGLSQFHPSSTANVAALALHCFDARESRIPNAADPDCPTVAEIADDIACAMSHEWEIIRLADKDSAGAVGETPWTHPTPIVLDTAAPIRVPAGLPRLG